MNTRSDALYAEHASPDSIRAQLAAAKTAARRAQRRAAWLEELLTQRLDQIEAGTWPPGTGEKQ